MTRRAFSALPLAVLLAATLSAIAEQRNGFDLSNATIPKSEILGGGPPRDGIPSIDAPKFIRPAMPHSCTTTTSCSALRAAERRAPIACLIWLGEGCPEGCAEEHWRQAELLHATHGAPQLSPQSAA
jgi:hypothetical protein